MTSLFYHLAYFVYLLVCCGVECFYALFLRSNLRCIEEIYVLCMFVHLICLSALELKFRECVLHFNVFLRKIWRFQNYSILLRLIF